jgi:radical SAM-linked protein
MSNYVLKYRRGGNVRYISHLDFVRMFHRAVRRSGLPMSFSNGFNPHPVMTVAMPLSVGVTSDCEFMKIGFEGEFSENEIKSALNRALPPGFEILRAQKVCAKELDFSKLDRAEYIAEAELKTAYTPDIENFLKNEKILVMKKSKSGIKEADIKPYIYDLKVTEQDGVFITLSMVTAAGNNYNLKPETVIDAIKNYQPDFEAVFTAVHRKRILAGDTEYLAE